MNWRENKRVETSELYRATYTLNTDQHYAMVVVSVVAAVRSVVFVAVFAARSRATNGKQ